MVQSKTKLLIKIDFFDKKEQTKTQNLQVNRIIARTITFKLLRNSTKNFEITFKTKTFLIISQFLTIERQSQRNFWFETSSSTSIITLCLRTTSRNLIFTHFSRDNSNYYRTLTRIKRKKYERLSIRVLFICVNWIKIRKLCIYFQLFKLLLIIWSHCANSLIFLKIVQF